MPYQPPVTEQLFLFDQIIDADSRAQRYSMLEGDTLEAIVEALAGFAVGEIEPLAANADREGARVTDTGVVTPKGYREAYRELVAGAWMSLQGPAEWGGQDMPSLLTAILMENLCSSDMAFSLCPMLSFGAMDAIEAHGSADQKTTWLPKLVSGEWTGTMNLTEPQAGSDVGALKTTAVKLADGRYKLRGQKIFITFGDHDLTDNIVHLVLARTPDAPAGTKGISLFLVPKFRLDEAGKPTLENDVRCASVEHKLGIHGSPTCVMLFGESDACYGELIGEEGAGMAVMFTMMNAARLQVGLQGVAVAEAATQRATAYALDRVQSARIGSADKQSVPIIQHPDVRRMLLRMRALTMGARALVYQAFDASDRARAGDQAAQDMVDILTPLAKGWGTDIGCEVASLGVQVHGGMGFIEETGAARLFRDIRIAPIYEGTNGIQAADLVNRKIALRGGACARSLLESIRRDAQGEQSVLGLADKIDGILARYRQTSADDRLAGSYPFMTMLAVASAAALLAAQSAKIPQGDEPFFEMKRAAIRYFLDVVVAEAGGLEAAALLGSDSLYACSEAAFAA